MKMVCVSSCIFRGDTVRKGRVVDVTEEEMKAEPARSSFMPPSDGGADDPAPSARPGSAAAVVVAGLTREQAIMKLYQSGVNVPERISAAKLRERFEETFGVDGR